jgi:hypothetical protein
VAEFSEQMNAVLTQHQERYLKEIKAPIPPRPEVLHVPPQTPSPQLQQMQYNKGPASVTTGIPNYWTSHEGDFGYPLTEPRTVSRPLSSRRFLHDPPRWFKRDAYPVDGDQRSETFMLTEPTVPMRTMDYPSPRSNAVGMSLVPEQFSFGTITGDQPITASLVLANTGDRPLHYAFSQINNPRVRLLSIPGVVFPGLKVHIQVGVDAAPPQVIETAFRILTNNGSQVTVPITATIVGPTIN